MECSAGHIEPFVIVFVSEIVAAIRTLGFHIKYDRINVLFHAKTATRIHLKHIIKIEMGRRFSNIMITLSFAPPRRYYCNLKVGPKELFGSIN